MGQSKSTYTIAVGKKRFNGFLMIALEKCNHREKEEKNSANCSLNGIEMQISDAKNNFNNINCGSNISGNGIP